MPIIRIPNMLRSYVKGQAEVIVDGATVGDALDSLMSLYPDFRIHIIKPDGTLRAFVNLFVADGNIKDLQYLETAVQSDEIINLVPSIAGG